MKLTYLGTAAAEGIPALFCDCEYCKEARKLGGENIRTRSQAIVNDDLLIDFPADSYSHFLANGIEGHKIKYLLITHSHSDHFYIEDFELRKPPFAHNMQEETLKIFCGTGTEKKLKEKNIQNISYKALKPFEQVQLDEYKITALPARHYQGDGALIYIIEGEKKILYAHDTGGFYEEVFEYFERESCKFDLISLDCTCVDIVVPDDAGHMGIENINRVVERLGKIGAVNQDTKIVINHFSHNANPIHHVLEERVKEYGYLVSYDGRCIEI